MPDTILFPIHVILSFLGESTFAIACASAGIYLIQDRELKRKHFGTLYKRLPSLSLLEELNAVCLYSGFGLMTLGVALGLVLARREWGSAWHWDPKLVFSFSIWFFLAIALVARRQQGWTGRKSAVLILFTFTAVLFTFMGVNFLSERHRFG